MSVKESILKEGGLLRGIFGIGRRPPFGEDNHTAAKKAVYKF